MPLAVHIKSLIVVRLPGTGIFLEMAILKKRHKQFLLPRSTTSLLPTCRTSPAIATKSLSFFIWHRRPDPLAFEHVCGCWLVHLKTKTKVQSRPQFETIQSLDPKGDQSRTTIGTPSRRALLVRGINSAQQ